MTERDGSNLCKSLGEILHDKSHLSMLPYFIQYMESAHAIHLVQFWFSVEAFRTAEPVEIDQCGCHNNSNNSSNDNHHSYDLLHRVSSGKLPFINEKVTDDTDSPKTDKRKILHSKYHWEMSSFMAKKSLSVESDALDIYTVYISLNALNSVNIDASLRQKIEACICPEDGMVKRNCFDEAQTAVFSEIETSHYPQFCRSQFLSKYQLEYISAGHLILTDILLNNNAMFYFMEFMESQSVSILPQFWSTIETYKLHFTEEGDAINSKAAFDDAMAIYTRYLSLLAPDPIQVEDVVRISVENKMCDERGALMDTFNVPQYLVYDKMNEEYYPLFLQSDQYQKYLCELLYTIEEPSHHTQPHVITAHQLSTTSRQDELDDPDELWRRPHKILRFGYVTKYGQFISEAETDPSPAQGHKIKRSLFTILGREEYSTEKMKAAWEMAEQIITQVLTLTQCSSSSSS